MRPADEVALFLAGLVTLMICAAVAYPALRGCIFFSWDSSAYIENANEQLQNQFGFYFTAAFTQSFGNISFPFNFHLLPETQLAFIDGKINSSLMYAIVTAEFYISCFIMSRVFGLGTVAGVIAGIAFVLLTMPFTSPPWYSQMFWYHDTFLVPAIYLWTALIVSYHRIGRGDRLWANVLAAVAFNVAILWAMLADAKYCFVIFGGVGIFCLIFTLGSANLREFAWKGAASAATIIFMLTVGPYDFLRGLYGFASVSLFRQAVSADLWGAVSGLMYPPSQWISNIPAHLVWVALYAGFPLAILSIVGAFWVLLDRRRTAPARQLALGVLLTWPYSFIFLYAPVSVIAINHVLVLFSVVPLLDIIGWAWKRGRLGRMLVRRGVQYPVAGAGFAALGLIIVFALPRMPIVAYEYPPARTPVVAFLEGRIRFKIDDRFHGRFLNLGVVRMEPDRQTMLATMFGITIAQIMEHEHNDLGFQGLRYYDIPETFEYNRFSTPTSVVFLNYLLTRPKDIDRIDYRVISQFRPRLLRMLGIRYVLGPSSFDGSGIEVVNDHPVGRQPDLRLFELADVNVGQYSPTEVRYSTDFREVLATLSDESFDPTHTILLHHSENRAATDLVPARAVEITRISDGLRISASSAGRSIVLLPFEYSHCFEPEIISGSGIRVERANLLLTALHFDRSVIMNLRFRFGPFTNSKCRGLDAPELEAMGLTPPGLAEFARANPDRLLLTGQD